MPISQITRSVSGQVSLTIANGAAVSDAFDFSSYAFAIVHMPAAWTAASIGFQVAQSLGGTYRKLYDKNNSLVQISSPAASQAHPVPADLAGCRWVKLWSQNGSGTNTNQGAARTITLDLKT